MNTLDGPDKPNPTADRYGINRMKQSGSRERKSGNRPVSRVLSRTVIHLRCPSPDTCSDLPGSFADRMKRPLFGLASGGVYRAAPVASRAVYSYRTLFTLTGSCERRRSILCGTFRRLAPPRRYLAPCPVKPGLSSIPQSDTATVQPVPVVQCRRLRCAWQGKTFLPPISLS